jgi:hypothetical protein
MPGKSRESRLGGIHDNSYRLLGTYWHDALDVRCWGLWTMTCLDQIDRKIVTDRMPDATLADPSSRGAAR